jgi:four helix bundle protein
MQTTFRFEKLDVWNRAAQLSIPLLSFADQLEELRRYRFAEQFRAAVLSVSNNIAEGSGSNSKKEFAHFLNFSRRSCFEVVNMLLIFERQGLCRREQIEPWLTEIEIISKMLESFRKTLGGGFKTLLFALCPALFAIG